MSFIAGYLLGLEDNKNESKTIGKNGEYKPEDGVRWDKVTVAVPIEGLTVSQNGTYRAADYDTEGFDPVNINVPDYRDEMERYRNLWLKEIGEGEPVETDIPKPGDPDDPDDPGEGGNYVFDNAVNIGGVEDLNPYLPIFAEANSIDLVDVNSGLAIHIGRVYRGARTDVQLTVTNLKNGKSATFDSNFYNSVDIAHFGCEFTSLMVNGQYVWLNAVSNIGFQLYVYHSQIDFHPPANWKPHFILI